MSRQTVQIFRASKTGPDADLNLTQIALDELPEIVAFLGIHRERIEADEQTALALLHQPDCVYQFDQTKECTCPVGPEIQLFTPPPRP